MSSTLKEGGFQGGEGEQEKRASLGGRRRRHEWVSKREDFPGGREKFRFYLKLVKRNGKENREVIKARVVKLLFGIRTGKREGRKGDVRKGATGGGTVNKSRGVNVTEGK